MTPSVARHRTAVARATLSRPMRIAIHDGLINARTDTFDYGCGRGDDLRILSSQGIRCAGWDPVHRPSEPRCPADVVNLGYVVNVIENLAERAAVLREAWSLARQVLVVGARLTIERRTVAGAEYGDGCLTGRRTFQKF